MQCEDICKLNRNTKREQTWMDGWNYKCRAREHHIFYLHWYLLLQDDGSTSTKYANIPFQ